MLIGYLPACSDADPDAQRQALAEAGCAEVVSEPSSTQAAEGHPELDGLLARLRPGDILVVPRLDMLARSVAELVGTLHRVAAAGAVIRSLAEAFDAGAPRTAAPGGEPAASTGPSTPERLRARHPAAAVIRMRRGGRPPKLSAQQQEAVADNVLSGRSSAAAMARRYRVSEATISRLLARWRADDPGSGHLGASGTGTGAADLIGGVLPLIALDERLAIVGTSGSGKTYAAKGLLERVMTGGGRVCVVDPLGVWWGLREGADGGEAPFPVVVFGGAHADVPVSTEQAPALARLVATHQLACVVDVSDLGSAAVRRSFMTAFMEALYLANTEPLHLVLDEADLWAPQRAQLDGHDLLHWVEEIVRRGRVRGFVPWLITQRPAVLHKDVLSQADILVSMKLTASQDRDAVGRWIEGQADRAEGRRILGALPRLGRGEGWVWAPSQGVLERVMFPRIRTRDSSQTPRQARYEERPAKLATVDLPAIRRALA